LIPFPSSLIPILLFTPVFIYPLPLIPILFFTPRFHSPLHLIASARFSYPLQLIFISLFTPAFILSSASVALRGRRGGEVRGRCLKRGTWGAVSWHHTRCGGSGRFPFLYTCSVSVFGSCSFRCRCIHGKAGMRVSEVVVQRSWSLRVVGFRVLGLGPLRVW
jgi:hypothetical protein